MTAKNIVLFLTDQERALQHFPEGWAERHLPGMVRLRRHGLSFERAYTNAAMCSPARATLFTGLMPAQHGVKYTLEEDMPAGDYPQVPLDPGLPNLATVLAAAGYEVAYKGKWHLSKPAAGGWAPADLARYGFMGWNPPDAGANQALDQGGGGQVNHDGRYLHDDGDPAEGREGVLAYLRRAAAGGRPFCLVVSLVNPHDVLFYPGSYREAGYDEGWLAGEVALPPTVDESLDTKPTAQRQFQALLNAAAPLPSPEAQRNYVNFYANLLRAADAHLVTVLDALDALGLTDDTLVIRSSDHGEMGLAHGLRQKNFNAYEESLRVPLVFSNPRLFPDPVSTEALVSHVDFLPTIAGLVGAPPGARGRWTGVDYSALLRDPGAGPVQDQVLFTYDDFQSGQARGPYPAPPQHIVCLREARYKLAEYADPAGVEPSQWEMYDLQADPLETRNLAHPLCERSAEEERQLTRLRERLAALRAERLRPRGP